MDKHSGNVSNVPEQNAFDRRQLLVNGGKTLVGVTLFGAIIDRLLADDQMAQQLITGVQTKNGGAKPVYVPAERTKDPVAISHADNLFWTDILSEHAMFFVMLMPGKELAGARSEAERFQATFAQHHQKARSAKLDKGTYASFNQSTTELVKPFIDYKHKMHEAQKSGKIHSLVWPLFFEHTANEAERFVKRLSELSGGSSEYDKSEVVDFWTEIMGEHAEFIAHLLDPEEDTLVATANKTATAFEQLHRNPSAAGDDGVMKAAEEILAFKEKAGKGILAGQVKSIIHPALADHVRREAVKFIDELRRTT
jgi:hypothetical protein